MPFASLFLEFVPGVECKEQLIFTFIIVQFRSPDAYYRNISPYILGGSIYHLGPRPVNKIFAAEPYFVHQQQ